MEVKVFKRWRLMPRAWGNEMKQNSHNQIQQKISWEYKSINLRLYQKFEKSSTIHCETGL
jgi:hypothetical protein